MRALFTSESRCISNLIRIKWNSHYEECSTVFSEYISEPVKSTRRRFNCDFALDFVNRQTVDWEHTTTMSSILPATLGAEVFLVVEKQSLTPMRLELLGGGAFPIKYFASYIELIEASLHAAGESQRSNRVDFTSCRLSRAAFARILIVGGDICFLYFPIESKPVMRGLRRSVAKANDRDIGYFADGEEIVCVDGWIHAQVKRTDEVLVAVPE